MEGEEDILIIGLGIWQLAKGDGTAKIEVNVHLRGWWKEDWSAVTVPRKGVISAPSNTKHLQCLRSKPNQNAVQGREGKKCNHEWDSCVSLRSNVFRHPCAGDKVVDFKVLSFMPLNRRLDDGAVRDVGK